MYIDMHDDRLRDGLSRWNIHFFFTFFTLTLPFPFLPSSVACLMLQESDV